MYSSIFFAVLLMNTAEKLDALCSNLQSNVL